MGAQLNLGPTPAHFRYKSGMKHALPAATLLLLATHALAAEEVLIRTPDGATLSAIVEKPDDKPGKFATVLTVRGHDPAGLQRHRGRQTARQDDRPGFDAFLPSGQCLRQPHQRWNDVPLPVRLSTHPLSRRAS